MQDYEKSLYGRDRKLNRVLHVGLPKSGSTALQRFLFSRHPDISHYSLDSLYLEEQCSQEFKDKWENFLYEVLNVDEAVFDLNKSKKLLNESILNSSHGSQSVVVSVEGFSSTLGVGIGQKALRLSQLFDGFKVLLVIRNPIDFLESSFFQTMMNRDRRPFFYGLPSFEKVIKDGLDHPDHISSPIMSIRYKKLSDIYERVFGPQSIKVLLYEDLRSRPNYFLSEVADLLEIDRDKVINIYSNLNEKINTRRELRDIVLHLINHTRAGAKIPWRARKVIANGIARTPLVKKHFQYLSEETRVRIHKLVGPECRSVAEKWGLDIGLYGYPEDY